MTRLIYKALFRTKPYGWRTLISWTAVDSRNLACHQLWAAYRWERRAALAEEQDK